jgi:hypothetical protein
MATRTPKSGVEKPEVKRYLATIENSSDYFIGTLEDIEAYILDHHDIGTEVELTEVIGKTRKAKLEIKLKFN